MSFTNTFYAFSSLAVKLLDTGWFYIFPIFQCLSSFAKRDEGAWKGGG